MNLSKIFDNRVMDTIVKSFGARFGTGLSSRQGIVQDLNRNVMLGTLSHIRRLSYPSAAFYDLGWECSYPLQGVRRRGMGKWY